MVPTFTTRSITEGGAHLYPGNIAMTTPQTFIMASSPDFQPGFGVGHPHNRWPRAASRPVFIRFEPSATLRGVRQWFLAYTFPALLAGPEPSDDADPSRALSGLLPPIRAFPRIDCPQLHRPTATGQRRSPLTSTRSCSASWRTERNRTRTWWTPRHARTAATTCRCPGGVLVVSAHA